MKDGRSTAPPPPDCVLEELTTRAVNDTLHTTMTPEEVAARDEDWINRVLLLHQALSEPT